MGLFMCPWLVQNLISNSKVSDHISDHISGHISPKIALKTFFSSSRQTKEISYGVLRFTAVDVKDMQPPYRPG